MRSSALRALALLFALPFAAPRAAAQGTGDRWQITLADGAIVWDVRLVQLDGDQLQVRQRDSVFSVPVARIDEFRLIKKSDMQLGAGGGGAMAALVGADDEVFDLKPLEFAERLRTVQQLLLYHPPGKAAPKP